MKNKIIYLSIFFVLALFTSCDDEPTRDPYPYSLPTIKATVSETEITFNDSITLEVEVEDKVTPLSTLEIKIVVNDVIISKESVRTKGNHAVYTKRYHVPFGAYMPDGAPVEVYLTSINVEGNKTNEFVSNTEGYRPEIPALYLATRSGAIQLRLTDEEKYIYTAENLTFGQEVAFLIPTKVTRFGRVDWTGLVFSGTDDELAIVEEGADSIRLSNKTIFGFNKIEIDLLNFIVTGEGEPLVPIEEMNLASFSDKSLTSTNGLGENSTETWKISTLYLGKNSEITMAGFTDKTIFNPDFFELTESGKVKFLGDTGAYDLYYLPSADYLFVENPDAIYPDAMWLCGIGFGPATSTYGKTSSWNWNTPLEYTYCRQISTGVYQATIYINYEKSDDEDNPLKYAFNAKFFYQRGWGVDGTEKEINAREYTISSSLIYAPTDKELGNIVGTSDFIGKPGIYVLTIDTTKKTISLEEAK